MDYRDSGNTNGAPTSKEALQMQLDSTSKLAQMLARLSESDKDRQQAREMPGIEQASKEHGMKVAADLEGQALKEESDRGMQLFNQVNKSAGPFGAKAGVNYGHFKVDAAQPGITQIYGKQGDEAHRAQTFVDSNLKDLKTASKATEDTLNALDSGDIVSQKMAILNEAKLMGGARGAAAFAKILDPSNTLPGFATKVENFVTGNGDIELTPSMINNMRNYAFQRANTLQKQYSPVKNQLTQQIAQQSPLSSAMGSLKPIQDSAFQDVDSTFDRINQKHSSFMQQQADAANKGNQTFTNPLPNYQPNQSVVGQIGSKLGKGLDGLMGMFGHPRQAQSAQTAPQAQSPQDPGMARYQELLKKSQQNQGQ